METTETANDSASLFLQEETADVHFIVGEQDVRIPAHKRVLADRSQVFHTMFFGKMAESSDIEEEKIPEIDADIFKECLRYIYTGKAILTPESVMNILYAGKKYSVQRLVEDCIEYLIANTKPENAFMLLGQAQFFGEESLAKRCMDVVTRKTVEAMAAESFPAIPLETLCSALGQPILVGSPLNIFQGCLKWAEEECKRKEKVITPSNQREVLGEAVRLMCKHHFLSMTLEEFSGSIPAMGILSDNELVGIFQRFAFQYKERERKEMEERHQEKSRLTDESREKQAKAEAMKQELRHVRSQNESYQEQERTHEAVQHKMRQLENQPVGHQQEVNNKFDLERELKHVQKEKRRLYESAENHEREIRGLREECRRRDQDERNARDLEDQLRSVRNQNEQHRQREHEREETVERRVRQLEQELTGKAALEQDLRHLRHENEQYQQRFDEIRNFVNNRFD